MKKMLKYVGLGILLFVMVDHTLPVKYLAPACYRLDLSMAVVLFMAVDREGNGKRVWLWFAGKEILALLFGNPGISFGMHLLITISTAALDGVLLILFMRISGYRGRKLAVNGMVASGMYILCCMILNGLYLARLYAAAYHATFSYLLELAGRYNNKVHGIWSYLTRCVAPFYVVQTGLVIAVVLLLVRLFCRGQEEETTVKDGTGHAAYGGR